MTVRRRAIRRGAGFTLAACLLSGFASAGAVADAASAMKAPPLLMNIDEFDRAKKTALLPNGITLGYAEFGDPAGPPLVLVHGYTDTARDWLPLVPYLPKSSHLILVDIRGHGRSSTPDCCYTRVDFAYDIKLLLDKLGIARADIVGHSLGSIITQTFAEYWPERTRKVVLVSSTGGGAVCTPPGASPPKPSGMDFRSEILKLKEPIDPESKFMVEWWASPTPVDAEFLRRQRRDAAAIPLKVWLAVLDQGLTGMDLQSTLPRLKAPTLLIWGAKDPIFGPEDRRTLQVGLPAARVIVYPDFGHNAFWEDPKRVARDLTEFLAE